jgi:hypothetical protein
VLTRVALLTVGVLLLSPPTCALGQAHARRSHAVPPQLIEQIRKDTTWEPRLERFRDSLAFLLIADRVDLDHDGIPELIVHGQGRICGANNCELWVYRRTSDALVFTESTSRRTTSSRAPIRGVWAIA